jgi:hypothetical protein
MPKTYPADLRMRAVAVAVATSLEEASRKLGIGKDTVARWQCEAPDQSYARSIDEAARATERLSGGGAIP